MSPDDRPLPSPPRSRFGGEREARGADEPLTADRMAQAAAAGRLEEFLDQEIPPGDHARHLAMMMMGMSGIVPADASPGPPAPDRPAPESADAAPPPPEVAHAIRQGDVAGLMGLLRAEHAKRNSGSDAGSSAPQATAASPGTVAPAPARPGIDAALVDELIRVAADNDVTVDWLMLRAVKLYVEEFRRTGRL